MQESNFKNAGLALTKRFKVFVYALLVLFESRFMGSVKCASVYFNMHTATHLNISSLYTQRPCIHQNMSEHLIKINHKHVNETKKSCHNLSES